MKFAEYGSVVGRYRRRVISQYFIGDVIHPSVGVIECIGWIFEKQFHIVSTKPIVWLGRRAIGNPFQGLLTSDFTVTTGIISSRSGLLNDTRYLQISAAVQPGNSGRRALWEVSDFLTILFSNTHWRELLRRQKEGRLPAE
jgi:hypothetical protein